MLGGRASGLACVAMCCGLSSSATAEPRTRNLVFAGLGLAPPTYAVGVVTHESSHALAAKILGARVDHFHVLPGRRGPDRRFYFGYVSVSGLRSARQRTLFWLAPKLTDVVLLCGFAAAFELGALPDNHYGLLTFTVLATGTWVDFAKDVIAWSDGNDIVKTYTVNGATSEIERLPWRALHLGLSVVGGIAIWRAYERVFAQDAGSAAPSVIIPVAAGGF